MTQQTYPGAWSEAINTLRLDLQHADPPLRESGTWRQAYARFTRRGFLRALLGNTPGADAVVVWIELILPERDAAAFGHELLVWATAHAASGAALVEAGPPAQLRLEWADGARALEVLTMLLKVGDYLNALEQDPKAPSPLAVAAPVAHVAPVAPPVTSFASAFEPIGAATAAPTTPAAPATPTAFEAIGATPRVADGPLRLMAREVSARGTRIVARLTLSREVSHGERAALRDGLLRTLRVRFDVEPRSADGAGAEIVAELDVAGEGLTSQLVGEVAAFFARHIELGALGLPLTDALGAPSAPATPRAYTQQAPVTPQAPAAPAADAEAGGVVLDLSGGAGASDAPSFRGADAPSAQGREGSLRAKDFTDPRLKRADATTPLVDVVLRHPGYAERATAQALGILLSVEHHRARALVEGAPCVIAWGVGREQAQTLKMVVEGAGGKVVLVEPGTFGQR